MPSFWIRSWIRRFKLIAGFDLTLEAVMPSANTSPDLLWREEGRGRNDSGSWEGAGVSVDPEDSQDALQFLCFLCFYYFIAF